MTTTRKRISDRKKAMPEEPKSQADKFRDLARELEANEDEEAFKETLKRVAVVPPVPEPEKPE